jgi:hypothetical protein
MVSVSVGGVLPVCPLRGSHVHVFLWYTGARPPCGPCAVPGPQVGPRSNTRPPAMSAGLLARSVSLAVPAVLTPLCAHAAPLSLYAWLVARCVLRVASCPLPVLAARWLAGVLASGSSRPSEGGGRIRGPLRPATEPAVWHACRPASHGRTSNDQPRPSKRDASSGRIEGREAKKTRIGSMSNKAHARCLFIVKHSTDSRSLLCALYNAMYHLYSGGNDGR